MGFLELNTRLGTLSSTTRMELFFTDYGKELLVRQDGIGLEDHIVRFGLADGDFDYRQLTGTCKNEFGTSALTPSCFYDMTDVRGSRDNGTVFEGSYVSDLKSKILYSEINSQPTINVNYGVSKEQSFDIDFDINLEVFDYISKTKLRTPIKEINKGYNKRMSYTPCSEEVFLTVDAAALGLDFTAYFPYSVDELYSYLVNGTTNSEDTEYQIWYPFGQTFNLPDIMFGGQSQYNNLNEVVNAVIPNAGGNFIQNEDGSITGDFSSLMDEMDYYEEMFNDYDVEVGWTTENPGGEYLSVSELTSFMENCGEPTGTTVECRGFVDFPWASSQGGFNNAEEFCNRCSAAYNATQDWALQNGLPNCDCCSSLNNTMGTQVGLDYNVLFESKSKISGNLIDEKDATFYWFIQNITNSKTQMKPIKPYEIKTYSINGENEYKFNLNKTKQIRNNHYWTRYNCTYAVTMGVKVPGITPKVLTKKFQVIGDPKYGWVLNKY